MGTAPAHGAAVTHGTGALKAVPDGKAAPKSGRRPLSKRPFFELGWHRLGFFGALLLGELLIVCFCYQFLMDIECSRFQRPQTCLAVREGMGRLLALALLCGLTVTARRRLFSFLGRGGVGPAGLRFGLATAAMLAGLAIMLLPAVRPGMTAGLAPLALALVAGAAISVSAALIGTAPVACWLAVLRRGDPWLGLAAVIALLSPELTGLFNGTWGWPPLTSATFDLVRVGLSLFSGRIVSVPGEMVIGFDQFFIRIGEPCSGMQGFALISLAMAGFIVLERRRLRLPFALVLFPIGLFASFGLNVVRITALVWIGARISPDLAVNAFHSYAGWLLFTLLSLALMGAAHLVPALWHSEDGDPAPGGGTRIGSFRADPVSAMLWPLVALLLSGLVVATFFTNPEAAYPYRVPAMCAGLALFLPVWARLDWRFDPLSVLAGIAVGILWIVAGTAAGVEAASPPFAGQGLPAMVWIVLRLVGTVFLVPLIEEAAFRAYLLGHLLKLPGPAGKAAAALVSSAAFAMLHDNGAAAFVAGLAFAAVYYRHGKLTDAVWAHASANLVVFATAATTGNWALI